MAAYVYAAPARQSLTDFLHPSFSSLLYSHGMSQELMRYQKKLQIHIDTYLRHLEELEALERSSEPNAKRKVKLKQGRLLEDKEQIVELLAITPPLMHDVIDLYPALSDELYPGIGVNRAPKSLKDVEARDYAQDDDE